MDKLSGLEIKKMRHKRTNRRKKYRLTRAGQVLFASLICILIGYVLWLVLSHKVTLKEAVFEFGYEDKIPLNSDYYFKGTSTQVNFDEDAFVFDGLGEFTKEIAFEGQTFTIRFRIIDNVEPEITIADEINLFTTPSIEQIYTVSDYSEVSVETNFDIEKLNVGVQSITITATDIYGNHSSLTKKVNIKNDEHTILAGFQMDIDMNTTMDYIINTYREERGLNEYNFAFAYYNTGTKETYYYNEDEFRIGGSIYKVPLNMLFYEKIQDGSLQADSKLNYCYNCYEAGNGSTAELYSPGSRIPLEFLQTQSIINSDNTASHILFEYFGYESYREMIKKYSSQEYPDEFLQDNSFNARYMLDTMKYLYENQNTYTKLIDDMKEAMPNQYFKRFVNDYEIAHKYGEYLGAQNDVGIVYTPTPYILVVLSNNEMVSAELNELVCEYTLKHPK